MKTDKRKIISNCLRFFGLILVLTVTLASYCPGVGSSNGPYQTYNNENIDTTNIRTLEEPVSVLLYVYVREFDFTLYKHVPLEGAAVHFYNSDTTVYSDTNGYTSAYFPTSTMPYKYGFEITKDGFKSISGQNWDTLTTLGSWITIERDN